jgi:peptide/nickel transport system permease protein
MTKGLSQKLLIASITLLGVIVLVFSLFQFFGDPVKLTVGQSGDQTTMAQIRKDLNLDQPKWKQLIFYLNDISPISVHETTTIENKQLVGFFLGGKYKVGIKIPYLGKSYQTKKPVTQMILKALPGTIILAIFAMLMASVLGIALGIIAAIYKDSLIDRTAIMISTTGISTPSFFAALALAYLLGIAWHSFTGLNFTGNWYTVDAVSGAKHINLQNWILPAITLGIRPLAMITQLTRTSMLEVLNQDFIRTAYAKGLSKRSVILKHAFRKIFTPLITAITGWTGELLTGAFFVEFIFCWSGVGKMTIDAFEKLDYPVLMGSILLSTCIFLFIHWISDTLNKLANPSSIQ